jgi:ribokinase
MKVLTSGSAMIDTIAIIDSDRIERMSMVNADKAFLLMEEGKKTDAKEISTHLGGGGVNSAVCFARLGFEAAALVKMGKDQRADNILEGFRREGVSAASARQTEKLPTGASVIVSSHTRNAAIFTYRGANTTLVDADIDAKAFAVDMVHVCSLSHPSTACFPRIVAEGKKNRAQISANPGQRQLTSRATELLDALPSLDILFVNRSEAEALMPALVPKFGEGGPGLNGKGEKIPEFLARGLSGGGFEMSAARFFSALLELGLKTAVITDGGRGSYVASEGRVVHCPIVKAKVAGTAGAGDAFAATFSAWRAMKKPVEEAAIAGAHNAAGVVQHVDTQTGLMKKQALDAAIAASKLGSEVRAWKL